MPGIISLQGKNMDIYFDDNYGKLYEKAEQGKYRTFYYNDSNGCIKHSFIYRQIPDTHWCDIVTPYGYGGPVVINVRGDREGLISRFHKAFEEYCHENNVVSEFVRFHPVENNVADFGVMYGAKFDRYTIGTNLEAYEDPVRDEFSKRCRKNIRQALNKGVTYEVTKAPENIDVFQEIYYSTMDRNEAAEYYYFGESYFEGLLSACRENILLVEAIFEGKTIAAGVYLLSDGVIHIHLSGTLTEYLYLSPAYILRYAATLWGKENHYRLIHHGGGRSNSSEDGLFKFKGQFGMNTKFEFYIGRKIWLPDVYYELSEKSGNEDTGFFPLYRKR